MPGCWPQEAPKVNLKRSCAQIFRKHCTGQASRNQPVTLREACHAHERAGEDPSISHRLPAINEHVINRGAKPHVAGYSRTVAKSSFPSPAPRAVPARARDTMCPSALSTRLAPAPHAQPTSPQLKSRGLVGGSRL